MYRSDNLRFEIRDLRTRIRTYDEIDRAEWSRLVQASTTGTWFQTPEAYEFYASQPELFEPFVVGIINPSLSEASPLSTNSASSFSNSLRGIAVGYVTVEKNAIKQFLTRRAIIVGGPCFANDATDEEVKTLMIAIKKGLKSKAIYIETRNFNDYSKWRGAFENAGFEYKKHLNFHIDCTDKEKMWKQMSETRRRQIKKALKSGVGIKSEGVSESEIKEWYEILKDLYTTKVKTPLFPLSFFLEYYRQGLGKYLLVKYEGKVIGGIMCPILNGKCIYEWYICGSDGEYKEQYPSVMATWAAMDYAAKHGLARFDVMGAGEPGVPYGVRDFKEEFGGERVEQGRFLYVANPILYRIGKMGVQILKRGDSKNAVR